MPKSAAPTRCRSQTSLRATATRLAENILNSFSTNVFDDPNLPGEMQTTVSLKEVFCGTEVTVVQEGVPSAIPAEACYLGWQESLILLAKLVEAEIPD